MSELGILVPIILFSLFRLYWMSEYNLVWLCYKELDILVCNYSLFLSKYLYGLRVPHFEEIVRSPKSYCFLSNVTAVLLL